ncbi:FecR family protein [Pedobacter sp. MR2016-24]|uniref:FecR family protein n=1 Tax=Pedobacter sp. MR2016-24 TaxID=2994466 RepID=UPI002246BA57|nr:FecR family protein [Pedobacter sp. MR2016-24]MCX2485617.1 FecR domain-containing protein [Pedobacter sp. MR2016-24]
MKDAQREYFIEILKQYRLGNATQQEIAFLEAYYNVFETNEELITVENQHEFAPVKQLIKNNIDQQIILPQKTFRLTPSRTRYMVAAVIFLAVSITAYYFTTSSDHVDTPGQEYSHILPGTNKATLTLSNGQKISLDDVANGEIAQQAGIRITKSGNGQLVYTAVKGDNAIPVAQNTISTPKGGQYQLILPDGTKVYLNAASTLSYPTAFQDKERLVELNGEAYFEVAKNKLLPFRVKSGQQTVEVLGTHFNVNAYADEGAIRTTLLEGAVKISAGMITQVIKPGQQAILNKNTADKIVITEVNTDKVIAWKNGVFSFENEDLKSVMRQISRWYNVEVIYTGVSSDEKYYGEISKNSKLGEVFEILELNNVHFDVEGKTIKVSPNHGSPVKQ